MPDRYRYMTKHQEAKYRADAKKERKEQLKGAAVGAGSVAGLATLALAGTKGGRKFVRRAFTGKGNPIADDIGEAVARQRKTTPSEKVKDAFADEAVDRIRGRKGFWTGRNKTGSVDEAIERKKVRKIDSDKPRWWSRLRKKKTDDPGSSLALSALQREMLHLESVLDDVLFDPERPSTAVSLGGNLRRYTGML